MQFLVRVVIDRQGNHYEIYQKFPDGSDEFLTGFPLDEPRAAPSRYTSRVHSQIVSDTNELLGCLTRWMNALERTKSKDACAQIATSMIARGLSRPVSSPRA